MTAKRRGMPQELRHTFISLLSASGTPAEEIARLAGHSSTRTTEVIYRRELRSVLTRLEQRIRPRGEPPVQLAAEGAQPLQRQVLDRSIKPRHTERHGHRLRLRDLRKEPEDDHAVAVLRHGDTPDKISDPGKAGQPRLNDKVRACLGTSCCCRTAGAACSR